MKKTFVLVAALAVANNGYYMIGDKDGTGKYNKEMFRPYTVAELEELIGISK